MKVEKFDTSIRDTTKIKTREEIRKLNIAAKEGNISHELHIHMLTKIEC